jgi:hypothetical protein
MTSARTPIAARSAEQRALIVRQLGAALAAAWRRRAQAEAEPDRVPTTADDDRPRPAGAPRYRDRRLCDEDADKTATASTAGERGHWPNARQERARHDCTTATEMGTTDHRS